MRPIAIALPITLLLAPNALAQSDGPGWPSWRGPSADGIAAEGCQPPLEWSEDKNIRWKVPLPGIGISTPIVWGDCIYLTTAIATDKVATPAPQDPPPRADPRRGSRRGGRRGGRGGMNGPAPTNIHAFAVLAIDRESGKELWRTTVREELPHEAGHRSGSQASSSPITDGERIYAFFGSRGIHCLDMKGELLWSKDLGKMRTRNSFGEGASPALHDGILVVNWDHEGEDFIVALDAKSGEERWRKEREEPTSWATPFIVEVQGKAQVIVPATSASRAYDLATGKLIWQLGGMTENVIPTPVYLDGVVYLMSGYRGNALQAIRLAGASGNLAGSEAIVWSYGERGTSYVPSAVLYGGLIYFISSFANSLSCLDAKSGEECYRGQRLEGVRQVYASPVAAAGRIYITSRDGTTKVIEHGREFKELASNPLDAEIDASAVIIGDEILLRGRKQLYCIAADDGDRDAAPSPATGERP